MAHDQLAISDCNETIDESLLDSHWVAVEEVDVHRLAHYNRTR